MADRGNVGLVFRFRRMLVNRNIATLAVQPTGNGPIINAAPFIASPDSIINVVERLGAQLEKFARVPVSGIWEFNDLSPGVYYATEAGVSRQWRIDVATNLTWTVTPVTSSFPVNASSISVG